MHQKLGDFNVAVHANECSRAGERLKDVLEDWSYQGLQNMSEAELETGFRRSRASRARHDI
jgi:hypothetical protein